MNQKQDILQRLKHSEVFFIIIIRDHEYHSGLYVNKLNLLVPSYFHLCVADSFSKLCLLNINW